MKRGPPLLLVPSRAGFQLLLLLPVLFPKPLPNVTSHSFHTSLLPWAPAHWADALGYEWPGPGVPSQPLSQPDHHSFLEPKQAPGPNLILPPTSSHPSGLELLQDLSLCPASSHAWPRPGSLLLLLRTFPQTSSPFWIKSPAYQSTFPMLAHFRVPHFVVPPHFQQC